jgi:hypothetical protein
VAGAQKIVHARYHFAHLKQPGSSQGRIRETMTRHFVSSDRCSRTWLQSRRQRIRIIAGSLVSSDFYCETPAVSSQRRLQLAPIAFSRIAFLSRL